MTSHHRLWRKPLGSVRNPDNESECSRKIISGSQIYTTIYSTFFFISTDGREVTISGGYCTSQMQEKGTDGKLATLPDGATFKHCTRKRPAGDPLLPKFVTVATKEKMAGKQ